MMELGDMPGMFPIFRISRFGTSSLKRVIVILNSSKCDPKTGLPKICVGDVFYMRGGPLRKKIPREGWRIVRIDLTRRRLAWCPPSAQESHCQVSIYDVMVMAGGDLWRKISWLLPKKLILFLLHM